MRWFVGVYGVIYKITNKINGKVYIGQTTQPRGFKDRYCADGNGIKRVYRYYEASKRYGFNYNVHLFNAIKKYGFDNFEVNEVFDIAYNQKDLDLKEEQYIIKYKSYDINYGYNIELGGNNKNKSEYARFLYAKRSYPVYCITNKRCFLSPRDVELEYGLRKGRISNGLSKYCVYKIKTEQFGILKFKRLFEDINLKYRNPVICLNTKEIFMSVNSASKYNNIEKK